MQQRHHHQPQRAVSSTATTRTKEQLRDSQIWESTSRSFSEALRKLILTEGMVKGRGKAETT